MDSFHSVDGPRPARRDELDEAIALAEQVFRLDVDEPPTMGQEFPTLLAAENVDNLYVVRVDGRIVSLVGCYEQTIVSRNRPMRVACIGAVCTHRDHRRRGYAGGLMDLAIERAREAGNIVMLISGRANLYLTRGASRITPAYHGTLSADAATRTPAEGARPYAESDLDSVMRLHDGQPLRYRWDPEPIRAMLNAYLDLGCRAWVHENAGRIDGFVLAQVQPPRWWGKPGHGEVAELIGTAPTVAPLCAAAVRELNLDGLDFSFLHAETDRLRVLRELGVSTIGGPWRWTVKVLDLTALLDGWVGGEGVDRGVTLTTEDAALTVTSDGAAVTLREADAVNALLFNDPDHWPAAIRRLPDRVRAALADTLPVPICSYGVNYI